MGFAEFNHRRKAMNLANLIANDSLHTAASLKRHIFLFEKKEGVLRRKHAGLDDVV